MPLTVIAGIRLVSSLDFGGHLLKPLISFVHQSALEDLLQKHLGGPYSHEVTILPQYQLASCTGIGSLHGSGREELVPREERVEGKSNRKSSLPYTNGVEHAAKPQLIYPVEKMNNMNKVAL